MKPTMNLTPHRGPSVWETPESGPDGLRLVAAAAGIMLTGLAWRTAPPRRFWIAGLGAASAVAALMSRALSTRAETAVAGLRAKRNARRHGPLDATLKETFPASDAAAIF